MRGLAAVLSLLACLWGQGARAAGCDLSLVVGYQLVMAKTITGYIEGNETAIGHTKFT